MGTINEQAACLLEEIRDKKPLIHNITNYVVMNYTANALLALGASPVMAHAKNEVADMVKFAGALVLNIGTLEDDWIESMLIAGKKAKQLNTPVILDPVGSGATPLRTNAAKQIINDTQPTVIRGNASEVLSLRNEYSLTKGVDSIHTVDEAENAAKILAQELQTTLAITGPVDLVTNGENTLCIKNGHKLMGCVTGTGCTATTIIGAFNAVSSDPVTATASALAFIGLAGEVAAENASAPGSYQIELLNALYTITPELLKEDARIYAG